MAQMNNNNVSVNFGFAGHVQSGTAVVVVRSRQGQMRSHTGKPHFLRYSKLSSTEGLERTGNAEACRPATSATPARAWPEIPPAAWASLVISRAITL